VKENGHNLSEGTIPAFIRRTKGNPHNTSVRIPNALAECKPQTWDNLLSELLSNLSNHNLTHGKPDTVTFELTTAETSKQIHQLTFQSREGRKVGPLNFFIPNKYYESWNFPWAEMYFLELSSAVSRKLFSKFLIGRKLVQYESRNSIWCNFWNMSLPSSASFFANSLLESHFRRY
jgi:hypothetical protein